MNGNGSINTKKKFHPEMVQILCLSEEENTGWVKGTEPEEDYRTYLNEMEMI